MNRRELVLAFAERTETDRKTADAMITAFTELVTETVATGEPVQISGFCKFAHVDRAARMSQPPDRRADQDQGEAPRPDHAAQGVQGGRALGQGPREGAGQEGGARAPAGGEEGPGQDDDRAQAGRQAGARQEDDRPQPGRQEDDRAQAGRQEDHRQEDHGEEDHGASLNQLPIVGTRCSIGSPRLSPTGAVGQDVAP